MRPRLESAMRLDPKLGDSLERLYCACSLPNILNNMARGDLAGAPDRSQASAGIPAPAANMCSMWRTAGKKRWEKRRGRHYYAQALVCV